MNFDFARDNNKCVICGDSATAAHHIFDRTLYDNGGYYLNNGASLCDKCHLEAEKTLISVNEIWDKIGIDATIAPCPDNLTNIHQLDKWGNIIIDGKRYHGPLFHQENVQKILRAAGLLYHFQERVCNETD